MARVGGLIWALCAALVLLSGGSARAGEYVGSLHEHSGYSDGWPGSYPRTYYASGAAAGLDFMGGSDHSDNLALPIVASEECIGSALPECLFADGPIDSFRKWDATGEQAAAATTADFTAFRGFEWTSDRFGHINVFFSTNNTNAKTDAGYVSMEAFWSWLSKRPELGGGGDGLATFNHPDAKKLSDQDPGRNWNDFAYVPAADNRVVGIEVFNDHDDFGEWYPYALDKGWHVGAVGAEDLGHRRSDDWGGPSWPKTVINAPTRSAADLRAAMLARHFYAVRRPGLGLSFQVEGETMGSRLSPVVGDPLEITAAFDGDAAAPHATVELVTSGGEVVASGTDTLDLIRAADRAEQWYFVRARVDDEPVAYSSPVWIEARQGGEERRWLAGDLHVHTCYSHDSYCPPNDTNTGPDEFYTAGMTVQERFAEAAARDLDFLAITDHNDVRSVTDPGFGSSGVIGIPAYENSLDGHAQMLGATRVYDSGDHSPAAVNAMADELRDDGGVFQLNHPTNDDPGPFTGCGPELDWTYGFDVRPDVVEVWNSSVASLPEAIAYWERCWLNRGERLGATGGSDSHWAALSAVQGAGSPTTWVLADDPSVNGVLDAIRAGRTTISRLPPRQNGGRLLLEADGDGDGTFEGAIGDTIKPGSALRVRSEEGATGLLSVRANGETIVDDVPLAPGGIATVPAVDEPGWVRAELRFTSAQIQEAFRCGVIPVIGELPCPVDQAMAAMTSPIWIAAEDPPDGPAEPTDPTGPTGPVGAEPVGVLPGPDAPGPAGAPPGRPPRIIAGPRRPALRPNHRVRIATLVCGSAPCAVATPDRVRLRTSDGRQLRLRLEGPARLGAGAQARVRLRVGPRARDKLDSAPGRARIRARIASPSGNAAARLRVRLGD